MQAAAPGAGTKRRWRWWAGALSAAESYLTSEVRDSGPECQAEPAQERLGGATPRPRSVAARRRHPASEVRAAAGRSYPASEASGGPEETPHVRGQGRPGETTSQPRPEAVTVRSHLEPEARGGSWEEQPKPRPRPAARRSNPRSSGCAGTGGPRGAIPR